jgi:hypothetical protein
MKRWPGSVAALALATVSLGAAVRTAGAQNPLDRIKRVAAEAQKKAEEVKRKIDSTRAATAAAKAAVDSAKASAEAALKNPTGVSAGTPSRGTASSGGAAVTPAGGPPGRAGAGASVVPSGGSYRLNRAAAKVDEAVVVPGQPGLTYQVSPRGSHVASVVLRGSRKVVVYDGVEGPKFDDVAVKSRVPTRGRGTAVLFSDDGSRWAYLGRQGDEWVLMVDGAEHARGHPFENFQFMDFSPGAGKHFWYNIDNHNTTDGRRYVVTVDRVAGPSTFRETWPDFSNDGERWYYVVTHNTPGGVQQSLVVDGTPAAWPFGAQVAGGGENGLLTFTGDHLHAITATQVPGADAVQLYLDGKPWMRVGGANGVYTAPAGPLVLVTQYTPFAPGTSRRTAFVSVGDKRVPGSDCDGNFDPPMFSDDGRHWAILCKPSGGGGWVMADGRKGRAYQDVQGQVMFTADGRPVYQAGMNGKFFVAAGDEEYGPYSQHDLTLSRLACAQRMLYCSEIPVQGGKQEQFPVSMVGSHIAFTARPDGELGFDRVAVVDGKALKAPRASSVLFSPDGKRFAFLGGDGNGSTVYVDGKPWPGMIHLGSGGLGTSGGSRIIFSPDDKHVAYVAAPDQYSQARGIAIDGKFFSTPGIGSNYNVTFSPDSKHVFWVGLIGSTSRWAAFVDGEAVAEFDHESRVSFDIDPEWQMGPDGVLTLVAQDKGDVKRFRIAPGSGSVDAMLAKAVAAK